MPIARKPSPGSLLFGPFELNAPAGELRKAGVPIRVFGQPIQILAKLLAHAGEVVTRDQLRLEVWGESTFVDFEHGLNAAINKLRRALGDSAESPRYIETVRGGGYRFIGDVREVTPSLDGAKAAIDVPAPVSAAAPAISPKRYPARQPQWWLAVIVLVAVCVAGWRFFRMPAPPPWKLTRLTADIGFTSSPALSFDGKLVAYSSDREANGRFDIYVQHVNGGSDPIRLTFDGAGNTTPDFSPDGSRLVFRSSRDGGGIYEVPSFGGQARLLAPDGFDPRYSPDGMQVAYWVGSANIANAVPGNGAIWVVPVAGGQPWQVKISLTSARQPIWSPDGRRLLVIGYASQAAHDYAALDWWLLPAYPGAGRPVRAGVLDALSRAAVLTRDAAGNVARSIPIANLPRPRCWLAAGGEVVFSFEHGDTQNLWAANLSEAGTMTPAIRRLTAGTDQEVDPSCAANGSIVFASRDSRAQIWSMPFDVVRGSAIAGPNRMTRGLAREEHPSFSADGLRAAFISDRSGLRNAWIRDLITGHEIRAAPSPFAQRYPELSGTGNRVAYSRYERDKRSVYVVAGSGGTPELLCADCLRATDWSHDESAILLMEGSPYRISRIDVGTKKRSLLLRHSSFHVLYGRFSPDDRWISFTVRQPNNRSWITIAPVEGTTTPVKEEAWIRISEEGPEDRANWSSDGNTLYFTSARDGYLCLWGQAIHAVTRRPIGKAFAAYHFHQRPVLQQLGWSFEGGRLAVTLMESTGNIWLMSRQGVVRVPTS